MNGIINLDNDRTKKSLLYLTIGLLSFCAFVGIIAIFVGDSTALWQIASTALIIYLMILFSSLDFWHNFYILYRISSQYTEN